MSRQASTHPEGTLLLIRHGIAEEFRPGQPDAERPLTEEGWKKTRAAMRGLVKSGWVPAVAFSSPYRRAQETLSCLSEVMQKAGLESIPTGNWGGLVPEGDPAAAEAWLQEQLRSFKPGTTLAVISHQPFLGELVYHLTGDSLEIRKASCTVVARTSAGWSFLSHLRPSELREKG